MSKHTPGPWNTTCGVATVSDNRPSPRIVAECDPGMIDCHSVDPIQMAEARANARLIAAAPLLLEVLKSLVDSIDNGYSWTGKECGMADARAAIAKAEGRDA